MFYISIARYRKSIVKTVFITAKILQMVTLYVGKVPRNKASALAARRCVARFALSRNHVIARVVRKSNKPRAAERTRAIRYLEVDDANDFSPKIDIDRFQEEIQ